MNEREIILSVFIKYLCILLYHKFKVKYIELGVVKVVLITVIIEKNTSSGLIYKKHLTFLIHCINDVFGLYSGQDTQLLNEYKKSIFSYK